MKTTAQPSVALILLFLASALALASAAWAITGQQPALENPMAVAAIDAEPSNIRWRASDLRDLGLEESLQNYSTQPTLTVWFATREDEVLTHARLLLDFSEDGSIWDGVAHVELRINNEPIGKITLADVLDKSDRTIDIDSRLLSTRNSLTFLLSKTDTDPCRTQVSPGAWRLIERGVLETSGSAFPLQNDLALLPIPFYDVHYDRNPEIPIVFLQTPTSESIKAAGIVAAWFGLLAGSNIRFPVSFGSFPDDNAVVFSASMEPFADSLPPSEGPSIGMIDHPRMQGKKLLVLKGEKDTDLVLLARALNFSRSDLIGPSAVIKKSSDTPSRLPYDAPRWLPMAPVVEFGSIPGADALTHEGLTGTTLSLSFRIAPDLFTWPHDLVRFTIDYSHLAASPELLPLVTIELNGQFVKTLPRPALEGGMAAGSVDLLLHRSRIRGYNRLQFHIAWPNREELCDVDPEYGKDVKTSIAPSSTIHFEQIPHFIPMPDVATFVDDGYPFTRLADLSETVIALPPDAAPEEIAATLSFMAHFAAVTGYPGVDVAVIDTAQVQQGIHKDRDLLIVGAAKNLDLLQHWDGYLPVELSLGRLRVRKPQAALNARAFLGGHLNWKAARKANEILSRSPRLSVVAGFESPMRKGRSVVLVTAPTAQTLPAIPDLMGFTQAGDPGGDLLVAGEDRRWRFRVGDSYDAGQLDWFTRLRWVSANHWLILLPSLMIAALIFARISRDGLKRRAWQRLHPEAK